MKEKAARSLVVAERVDGVRVPLARGTRAVSYDGDLRGGRRHFLMAYLAAEQTGDSSAMAVAALGMCGLWVHEHRTATGSALLRFRLQTALARVDPDSALALRLRIRLGGESDYRDGRNAAILALLDEARSGTDAVARAEALSLAHHCLLGPDHVDLRRSLATELVQESFATERRSDLMMGLLWETVDLFQSGDPHAERRLRELSELLEAEDHLAVRFVVGAMNVMLAVRAGRYPEAEQSARECFELGTAAGDVDATGWYAAQTAAIRWYQGRLPELVPMLSELVHSATLSVVDNSCLAVLALAAATAGDRSKATSTLAVLRRRDLTRLPRSSSWLVTMNGIVETAHLLEDTETSEQAYRLLGPFAHLPMMLSLGVACFGSVHHALGVASLTMGEADRAVDHLREAVRQNLALAHWPAVAASRSRLAQALELRGGAEDARAARRELAAVAEETAAWDVTAQHPTRTASLSCTRQGQRWRFDLAARRALVEHSIGMLHLAVLIANPGQEIAAIDLISGLSGLSEAAADLVSGQEPGRRAAASVPHMSAQPILDPVASREYRLRLTQLGAEIEDLEARGLVEKVAHARRERDWLLTELAGAIGLGGRSRSVPNETERARIAAGKAIRRAVARIAGVDPAIGEHLRETVHTGVLCSYRPM